MEAGLSTVHSIARSCLLGLGQEVQGRGLLRRVGLWTGQRTHARASGSPSSGLPWLTPKNVRSTVVSFLYERRVNASGLVQVWGQVLCGVVTSFQVFEDPQLRSTPPSPSSVLAPDDLGDDP